MTRELFCFWFCYFLQNFVCEPSVHFDRHLFICFLRFLCSYNFLSVQFYFKRSVYMITIEGNYLYVFCDSNEMHVVLSNMAFHFYQINFRQAGIWTYTDNCVNWYKPVVLYYDFVLVLDSQFVGYASIWSRLWIWS